MKELLYSVAKKANGDFVTAKLAEKGDDFSCPTCNGELILNKSGNTGKYSKRSHFKHKILTPNCTPESALHYAFKIMLAQKIQTHIDKKISFQFQWKCDECNSFHKGNLLKKIKSVKVEHTLAVCKPDIALFDENGKVFAVIEIVVTHKPEESVLKFYRDNNIILIQKNLHHDNDIYELEKAVFYPTHTTTECVIPIFCEKCNGRNKHTKYFVSYKTTCENCETQNLVCYIDKGKFYDYHSNNGDMHNLYEGIWEFTKQELDIAKKRGLNVTWKISKNEKYYRANSCSKCGEIIREQENTSFYSDTIPFFFDRNKNENERKLRMQSIERIEFGYYCYNCEEKSINNH